MTEADGTADGCEGADLEPKILGGKWQLDGGPSVINIRREAPYSYVKLKVKDEKSPIIMKVSGILPSH